jgi:hypothetical protein
VRRAAPPGSSGFTASTVVAVFLSFKKKSFVGLCRRRQLFVGMSIAQPQGALACGSTSNS